MANPSYLAITQMFGQILYSGQLSTTSATTVYTVPASTTVKIATATLCNTSASAAVTVTFQLLAVGQTADGTHPVISGYILSAGDTLSLRDFVGGAMLATGEAISITAGTANLLGVVITGAVSS